MLETHTLSKQFIRPNMVENDVALTAAYARYEGMSIGPKANAKIASKLIMRVRPNW